MAKKGLLSAVSCMGALCLAANGLAADNVEKNAPWVVKASYDYYSADRPSGQLDGLGFSSRVWAGVEPESDISGDLQGVTFNVGRILSADSSPRLLGVDLTIRNGDLDGSIVYHKGTAYEQIDKVQSDREDIDLKLVYQWLGDLWQPYVGAGYFHYNLETTDTMPLNNGGIWGGNLTKVGHLDKKLNAASLGGGLGIALPDLGPFQLNCKADMYLMYGKGKVTDDREPGDQEISGNNWGYMAKGTFMINYPFTFANGSGGVFLDMGYQYQQFEFDEPLGQDKWYGPYARLGVGMMF